MEYFNNLVVLHFKLKQLIYLSKFGSVPNTDMNLSYTSIWEMFSYINTQNNYRSIYSKWMSGGDGVLCKKK